MAYTQGFQGQIGYTVEAAYGAGVTASSVMLLLATNVQDVRLTQNRASLNDVHSITSPDIDTFVASTKMFGVTTNYLADRVYSTADNILYHAITRSSADLSSLAMEVGVGVDQTTSTYFNLKGCKAKSATVNVSEDGPVNISIDWSVKDVAVSTALTATAAAAAITTEPWNYVGGSFTRKGSATWGYIVGSVSLTINNGLQEGKDIGNSTIVRAHPGIRSATGTANVCLTDGGLGYWAECANQSADTIQLLFGAVSATAPMLQITGCIITSLDIPLDSTNAVVMTQVPFTGKSPSLILAA